MRSIPAICLTLLTGCNAFSDLEVVNLRNADCDLAQRTDADLPDLAKPSLTCAAAKGLPGTPLTCVDFAGIPQLTAPQLTGWDFDKYDKSCWELAAGKLQVKSFGSFTGTCGFLMPAVSAAQLQPYSSVTLSIVQKLSLNSLDQKAQIMFGGDDDQRLLLDWMTGRQPRKQWTQTVATADFPAMALGAFQPLFKLTSLGAGGSITGWQIESIAVLGNPQ